MGDGKYILEGREPRECSDLLTWARWFETGERTVARSIVGQYSVSTIFLGLDHRFFGQGPPLVFETMAFDSSQVHSLQLSEGGAVHYVEEATNCARYSTWDDAEKGHAELCALLAQETGKAAIAMPLELGLGIGS